MEEIETRSKRTVEEKEKLREEKDIKKCIMKKNILATCVVILLMMSGCQLSMDKQTILPVLDLGATIGYSVPDTFVWNNVAKRVSYLPVSTTDSVLLALARPVYIGKDFHYMVDHKTSTVFRMDKKGKIISSFSKKGQGPGEYVDLTYVHVEPENRMVCVYDQKRNKYIMYDLDGNFIHEISFAEKKINTPLLITSDYALVKGVDSGSECKLYLTDKTFNIEKGIFPLDMSLTDMERLCLIWRINYCRNRDQAIVHYADEDTVFTVTKGGISPICILEKGAYKLPPEKAKELLAGDSPYLQAMGLSLISNHYVVSYLFKNKSYDEIWDKANNRILSRFSNEGGKFGIPFRLPNGKKTWINTRSLYIDSNAVAFSIGADVASEGGVPGVDEDGNPVLVIMEL